MSLAFEDRARAFCAAYLAAPPELRFVLGRGDYAMSIAAVLPIAGFVDDHSDDTAHGDIPVVRSSSLPGGAMVVVASMLRPITALASLDATDADVLDYFAFERFAGLDIRPVTFWPAFRADYAANRAKYDAVRERLVEPESRDVFDRLVSFRLTGDVSVMQGFRYDMVGQYFEDFLALAPDGESFVDIGCFDGFTSLEFARRAPRFEHITAFEPSPTNHAVVVANLSSLGGDRVTVHQCGLSDAHGTVTFSSEQGSSSRVSDEGDTTIRVERLDDLGVVAATFLKMDIEGAEEPALQGAVETIRRFRPRLAISVYHRSTDFWRIPELIDAAGVDYELRMRHYTEGIDETVMFFLPVGGTHG
ncbi:MAG: FkbM family methyltransferase [Actinobacteria bacterium]|nr:FkbM family methyltransferase [Actinomycetota bacterium]